jgi:glycosyltransferase involved in cell wall biosynthesis
MPTDANPKPTREPETCPVELSVVMPCLNEAETLPECIAKVQRVLYQHRIAGEIIVADNGSTDGSSDIAARMGVRVVRVKDKGYGNALRGGTASARGKYVITVDADNSHDLAEIPTFLNKLQSGYDLVIGNRFTGGIQPGAMPPTDRSSVMRILHHLAGFFPARHQAVQIFMKHALSDRMHMARKGA